MYKIFSELDSVKTETLMAAIYGSPGIGKTSLAFTAKKPVLFDFDQGAQRAVNKKTIIRVDEWDDIEELKKSPEFAKLNPGTIILDTGGTMLDNYIADYVKKQDPKNARRGGELSLQGYGAMKSVFKQFKDWTKSQNVNIIFICHAKDEKDGDNIRKIPLLTGGSVDILRQESDLIGYMYSNLNNRVIDFRPNIDMHEGKDCAGIGLVEVPDYTTDEYANFLGNIIDSTLKKMNEISEKQKELVKLANQFDKKAREVKDIKGINELIVELKDQGAFVQRKCFATLKEHCEKTGIATYDSKQKKFIANAEVES